VILVDSNVLIALASPRDRLHAQAVGDLRRLAGRDLFLASPVLTEVFFALPAAHMRARLTDLIHDLDIRPLPIENEGQLWRDTFDWLARYAEHVPDFADGLLAVASARDPRWKVWTYDAEFRTLWRRPDGSRIPLAVRPPSATPA
jgi:predicted nucleic acid-binding protein